MQRRRRPRRRRAHTRHMTCNRLRTPPPHRTARHPCHACERARAQDRACSAAVQVPGQVKRSGWWGHGVKAVRGEGHEVIGDLEGGRCSRDNRLDRQTCVLVLLFWRGGGGRPAGCIHHEGQNGRYKKRTSVLIHVHCTVCIPSKCVKMSARRLCLSYTPSSHLLHPSFPPDPAPVARGPGQARWLMWRSSRHCAAVLQLTSSGLKRHVR